MTWEGALPGFLVGVLIGFVALHFAWWQSRFYRSRPDAAYVRAGAHLIVATLEWREDTRAEAWVHDKETNVYRNVRWAWSRTERCARCGAILSLTWDDAVRPPGNRESYSGASSLEPSCPSRGAAA